MKERPILFNSEMVRAILEGRKTQTRRVINCKNGDVNGYDGEWIEGVYEWAYQSVHGLCTAKCPFGQVGDRLWVRETFHSDAMESPTFDYKADMGNMHFHDGWTPSIHMPRWASRITLEITGVRVERLCDICENDARAEGIIVGTIPKVLPTCRAYFHLLWQSIYKNWYENPYVWIIEFKVI